MRLSELKELAAEAAAADAELHGVFDHLHPFKGCTQAKAAMLAALEAQTGPEAMGDARLMADEYMAASKRLGVSAPTPSDEEELATERMRGLNMKWGPMWTAGAPRIS